MSFLKKIYSRLFGRGQGKKAPASIAASAPANHKNVQYDEEVDEDLNITGQDFEEGRSFAFPELSGFNSDIDDDEDLDELDNEYDYDDLNITGQDFEEGRNFAFPELSGFDTGDDDYDSDDEDYY